MSDSKTNFIKGSARKFVFDNGGEKIAVSLKLEELEALGVNEQGYVRFALYSNRGGKDQFGNSHYIAEDTFKPDPNYKSKSGGNQQTSAFSAAEDDIPF